MDETAAKPTKSKKNKKPAQAAAPVAKAAPVAAPEETAAPTMGELMLTIKALEAKVAAGEEAAMKRVCKALNIDPADVSQKEGVKGPDTRIIRCFVHHPVRINNNVYQGQVEVPYHVFEVIQEALGKRRQRLLRELTGNNYILKELSHGGMAPVLVGQVGMEGESISNG